jgi:hypothetical protein
MGDTKFVVILLSDESFLSLGIEQIFQEIEMICKKIDNGFWFGSHNALLSSD